MNPELPDEARDWGTTARRAFDRLGGVDLARRAEVDPTVRAAEVEPLLDQLGVVDLDPRDDLLALAAAAALCEAAGAVALPYPLPAALVRDADGRPCAVVPGDVARVDHATAVAQWRVASWDGRIAGTGSAPARALGTRLGPFVGDLSMVGDVAPPPLVDLLVQQALVGWTVLGGLDACVHLATEHVGGRIQFGHPLSHFQAVQFQLADAAVAVAGLRELAAFTIWRVSTHGERALADVLALRTHAIDVARAVLRTTQQLHGAAGVCDEYDVSVHARMLQPAVRLPEGAERTATRLADTIASDGFDGLFPHGGDLAAGTDPVVAAAGAR